jgi:hypothetical protein
MVMDAAPQIEVINNVRVKQVGHKIEQKIQQLK